MGFKYKDSKQNLYLMPFWVLKKDRTVGTKFK